jgi:hypothetical protein
MALVMQIMAVMPPLDKVDHLTLADQHAFVEIQHQLNYIMVPQVLVPQVEEQTMAVVLNRLTVNLVWLLYILMLDLQVN